MTTSDRWNELALAGGTESGITRLRVAPDSTHDLFIGVIQPNARRVFWYEVPSGAITDDYRLPHLRSIRVTVTPALDGRGVTRVQLELEQNDLSDVFNAMVNDLASAVALTRDNEAGLLALSQRAERWRRLLETQGGGGMSAADRRGLAGELIVLNRLLDMQGDVAGTVAMWTGPYGKHQDFQAGSGAIEVKTTVTKQPQSLIVTSERELDRTGVPHLFLLHVSLDERRGGSGLSLNDLVVALRSRLAEDALALPTFEEGLVNYGYLPDQAALYETTRYTVRELNAFEVVDGFPCITERDVPTGVGDVEYRVQLSAMVPFAVPTDTALTVASPL